MIIFICDVVCYREREGEVNSLTLLYLNQQALRLTAKMVHEKRSATWSLLNKERNPGHSSIVAWQDSGSRKSRMIGPQTLGTKMPFSVREIWKRIFSFGQKSARETCWSQPTLGRSLTHKKREKEIWTLKFIKDKYNLNCFPSTIPKHYYNYQSGDWDTFTWAREKEREKKEKEEKECWETFMFDTSCWLNIASILIRKEKRKRNCFLNLIFISLVIAN